MKYVLDASVAYKWEVPEPDSDKAIRLRDAFRAGVHGLIAPDYFPLELAHALTKAERQGSILPGQAYPFWTTIVAAPPVLYPSFSLAPRAMAIANRMRIGFYDCVYVALAERERCELVTADQKLVNNLQTRFPFIVPLSSLP
jgi:predicted nucleic acid-binding protein